MASRHCMTPFSGTKRARYRMRKGSCPPGVRSGTGSMKTALLTATAAMAARPPMARDWAGLSTTTRSARFSTQRVMRRSQVRPSSGPCSMQPCT